MDESSVCTFSAGDGHRNFCHSFVTRATVALVSGDPGYTYTKQHLATRRTALHKWRVWSVHFALLVGGREGGREGGGRDVMQDLINRRRSLVYLKPT